MNSKEKALLEKDDPNTLKTPVEMKSWRKKVWPKR